MAEIGSINSSSPAQAFQRPNSAGGQEQGGSSSPVEDSVQISSAGREQNSVQSQGQASVREGATPSVDDRIEANADPSRNSVENQDIETEVSDIQEANTENSSAAPEQNVSTLQREQAEQSSENGALSSAQSNVEQRGQSIDQIA